VVRGALDEPMLRIDPQGVWVNLDSPTAAADRLVARSGSGWTRVSGGRSIAWHDHRLSPPPANRPGLAGPFSIPISIDNRRAEIVGTFWRVRRPAAWPWLAAAAALVAAIAAVARFRRLWCSPLTVG